MLVILSPFQRAGNTTADIGTYFPEFLTHSRPYQRRFILNVFQIYFINKRFLRFSIKILFLIGLNVFDIYGLRIIQRQPGHDRRVSSAI